MKLFFTKMSTSNKKLFAREDKKSATTIILEYIRSKPYETNNYLFIETFWNFVQNVVSIFLLEIIWKFNRKSLAQRKVN